MVVRTHVVVEWVVPAGVTVVPRVVEAAVIPWIIESAIVPWVIPAAVIPRIVETAIVPWAVPSAIIASVIPGSVPYVSVSVQVIAVVVWVEVGYRYAGAGKFVIFDVCGHVFRNDYCVFVVSVNIDLRGLCLLGQILKVFLRCQLDVLVFS